MPRLSVDMGHGVRQQVEVTPNMTLSEVLAAACAKRGLDTSAHGLRHGRTRRQLDLTTIFRLSGLDNNATVELTDRAVASGRGTSRVASGGGSAPSAGGAASSASIDGAVCRIAVQLESGERRTGSLPASASLLDALQALCPELLVPGALAAGHAPGIIYGRPVCGVADLSATSLAEIGIRPAAAALLRFRSAPEGEAAAAQPLPENEPAPSAADPPTAPLHTDVAPATAATSPAPHVAAPAPTHPPPPAAAPSPALVPVPAPAPAARPLPAAAPCASSTPASHAVAASAASQAVANASDPSVLKAMLRESLLSLGQTVERLGAQAADAAAEASAYDSCAAALPPPPPVSGHGLAAGAGDGIRSLLLLRKYASNILSAPGEPKYRTIRLSNASFRHQLGRHAAARAALRLVGFVAPDPTQEPEARAWVLQDSADTSRLAVLTAEIDELIGAAPFPPARGAAGPTLGCSSAVAGPSAVTGPACAAGPSESGEAWSRMVARPGRGVGVVSGVTPGGASLPAVDEDAVMVEAPVRPVGGGRNRAQTTLTEAQVRTAARPEHTRRGGAGGALHGPQPGVGEGFGVMARSLAR